MDTAVSMQPAMSSSSSSQLLRLPSLSSKAPSPSKIREDKPLSSDLELPLLPSATKADKYARLSQFDRNGLKRQKAHFRNALKTTDNIQKITKQLNERLAALCKEDKGRVSFERLAAHRDAFEALIKQSGEYAPMLDKIKDAYHHHIMDLLSQDTPVSMLPPPAHGPVGLDTPTSGHQLEQLRKELHQLEIEYRVTTQQTKVLEDEVAREEEIHKKAMAELTQPIEVTPPHLNESQEEEGLSYAAKVEELQMMIADEQEAIAKVASERKGRIPLSVCHQLEQCIREVDIEIQKQQRRNQKLKNEIEDLTKQVETIYAKYGHSLSEVFTELGIQ